MPVSFRSDLFTSYISKYIGSETYSRKYEKLPNKVIHTCKNIRENMNLLKMCGPHIRLCLFTFRPIASNVKGIQTKLNNSEVLKHIANNDILLFSGTWLSKIFRLLY